MKKETFKDLLIEVLPPLVIAIFFACMCFVVGYSRGYKDSYNKYLRQYEYYDQILQEEIDLYNDAVRRYDSTVYEEMLTEYDLFPDSCAVLPMDNPAEGNPK